jgi:prepilin-type N-terminal cleavage/methylation domain-containing protein
MKGFTLIELLITVSIVVIILLASFVNLRGGNNLITLNDTTRQVATLLRQAQSNAMAQKSNTTWGVHFENATITQPFYALFGGASYSTTTIVGRYILPTAVAYTTSTLASGATRDVLFAQITGIPSASTTIGFLVPTQLVVSTTLVTVSVAGAVSY